MRILKNTFMRNAAVGAITALVLSLIVIPLTRSLRSADAIGSELFFVIAIAVSVAIAFARLSETKSRKKHNPDFTKIYKLSDRRKETLSKAA